MTLNGVTALILHFLPNLIALQTDYVTEVEDRPIMSVKYCLPVCLSLLSKTNAPCSALSLSAEQLVCFVANT